MHKILGIRLNIIGEFPKEPAIIMFNHPSYFDIFYNIGKYIGISDAIEYFHNDEWALVLIDQVMFFFYTKERNVR